MIASFLLDSIRFICLFCIVVGMSGGRVRRRWDTNLDYWVRLVREGRDDYREFMNKPYYLDMVGDISGLDLLDLACGEGYFSRIFAESGANVTSIDFSEGMIGAAVDEEERVPLGIRYITADATDMHMLEDDSFDVVCSFMALMDIRDYEGAVREVSRVLRDDGRFVCIFLHPCFSWKRIHDGVTMSDWVRILREDGLKDYPYLKVVDYFTRHNYEMTWRNEETGKDIATIQFHRTLSDYFNTMGKVGLFIRRMEEPKPVNEDLPHNMTKLFRIPHSILIEAVNMR